ncbi:bile acid:sodium symporter [Bacteriovoracales bacterium]|nr:bile acid:sodium symporter [Bacteriovoracales bacterium]
MIGPIEKVGLGLMIFVLMMGMGSTLSFEAFKNAFKNPKGLFIGLCSQFGLMPIIAFILAKVFDLPTEAAISLIMLGSAPGGTTSNLFAYFAKGDLALSISMTCFSTIMAFFMMPLCLKLTVSSFTDVGFFIPYKNIIFTLISILIPVSIGMFINSKNKEMAKKTEKAGSIIGIVVIIFVIVVTLMKNSEAYLDASGAYYFVAIFLGIFGFIFGLAMSKLFKLSTYQVKAVSLETGIQNTPLTIAIIMLSFPEELHQKLLVIPAIYALFIVLNSCVFSYLLSMIKEKD